MKLLRILGIGGKGEKPAGKAVDTDAGSLYPRRFFRNNDALMKDLNRLGVGEITSITYVD